MMFDDKENAPHSGTMREVAPPQKQPERMDDLLHSEIAYLQTAFTQTLHDVRSDLHEAVRPQVVTRSHPWAATGAAAAVGFALAARIRFPFQRQAASSLSRATNTLSPVAGLIAAGWTLAGRLLPIAIDAFVNRRIFDDDHL